MCRLSVSQPGQSCQIKKKSLANTGTTKIPNSNNNKKHTKTEQNESRDSKFKNLGT